MIRQLDGLPAGVIGFEATKKLTAQDYRDVLMPALEASQAGGGKIRMVFVFKDDLAMEPGAVWQDMKLGTHNWSAWERVAIVTDQDWLENAVKMFAWAMPGEVRAFDDDDFDDAVRWAAAPDD